MVWKKWAVRGLVFCILGGLALVGILYRYFTNPEAVRGQVLARVEAEFVGVHAGVGSARLRLFGGIAVQELRLSRRDDLDRTDFLYVPTAIIYHDKEKILKGERSIRKVEIHRPRLRAVRDRDGRWNLAGLLGETDLRRRLPTLVIQQGTLVIEDRRAPPGTAPVEIKNLQLTMVNDPLPLVTFEGTGSCAVVGPLRIRGRWQRGGGPVTLTVEAPAFAIGPELAQHISGYCPQTAADARNLWGKGRLQATLTWAPQASPPLAYAVTGELTEGGFSHARLPWPLEGLRGKFLCADGQFPHAELHARAGPIELDLVARDLAFDRGAPASWTDAVRQLDVTARHVPVDADLFRRLPPELAEFRREYSPSGVATIRLAHRRLGPGRWRRDLTLEAEDMGAVYEDFTYPVRKIRGTITMQTLGTARETGLSAGFAEDSLVKIDLLGEAGGRPVRLKGEVEGERGAARIHLDLTGNDLPVDRPLLDALPPRTRKAALSFSPTGLVDFRVEIRRPRGRRKSATRFLVHLHDGTACYDVFPLPLTDVSGTLDVQPDHWAFRDFVGHHQDGEIRASGRSFPLLKEARTVIRVTAPPPEGTPRSSPDADDEKVSVVIEGRNLPLDDPFRTALAHGRPALARAWDAFRLAGRMNFRAQIDDVPDQPQDIDVTVGISGCQMRPDFFDYPLEQVTATVRYVKDSAWLHDFEGRHGDTVVRVKRGRVYLPREGGFWAELNRLVMDRLRIDADLLHAVPPGMRKGLTSLELRNPINVNALLIAQQSADPTARTLLYWRGGAELKDVAFSTGVDWSGVTGAISCEGRHNGEQLEDVVGNVYFQKATVLGQPLRNLHAPLVVLKGQPDILRIPPGLKADLFGGTVGGEARVEFGSIFRYEMRLGVSGLQLEQFGRHNLGGKAELSGVATANLHLKDEGAGLEGKGVVDVPSGKLYRLPLLLDLLKWLGLRPPDRTAFEQAHVAFGINGTRIQVTQLDLVGNAISVRGTGTMNLDGTDLNLDLNADWGRVPELLPPALTGLSREISNQLLRIKVRGRLDNVRFDKEFVPVVTDPLKRVWKGVWPGKTQDRGRSAPMMK
jgi:hypothetical protein